MSDIMMDIETLDTGSNAVVVSISAIKFDRDTGEMGDMFEGGIKLQPQLDKGATMSADTVMWWLSQSKDAQNQLTRLFRADPEIVLSDFNMWIGKGKYELWGNGATFDNVIVRNLFDRFNIPFQVPFWNDRCVRTYVSMNKIDTKNFSFTGTKHNGLDDCRHQIKYMTGGR